MTEDAELTDAEKLLDSQKENDALRVAVSAAWQAHIRCQESLDGMRALLSVARAEANHWREVAAGSEIK